MTQQRLLFSDATSCSKRVGMHAGLYLELATPPLALGVDALLGRHAGMIMMRGDSSVLLQRPPPCQILSALLQAWQHLLWNCHCASQPADSHFSKSVADSKADG